jgi:hypothetical protein
MERARKVFRHLLRGLGSSLKELVGCGGGKWFKLVILQDQVKKEKREN